MPLLPGADQATISRNIGEVMRSYKKKKGKIGTSRPASAKKAQQQAIAVSFDKARESRKRHRVPAAAE